MEILCNLSFLCATGGSNFAYIKRKTRGVEENSDDNPYLILCDKEHLQDFTLCSYYSIHMWLKGLGHEKDF
jgi:hypothetical protein